KENSYEDVTHYNNFYEFGTEKSDPAKNAKNFTTSNWMVSVEGEVAKPHKFTMDEILKLAPLEERIYRHRCVEAWSIVVPWIGYSLSALLQQVQPTAKAKYVAFESFWDTKQMPLARPEIAGIQFPYVEGLRLDEAMHPLAQSDCVPGALRAGGLPRLAFLHAGPRRQPARVHHALHRRLDHPLHRRYTRHHAAAQAARTPRPHPLPPHDRPLRLLLRLPS